MIRRVARPGPLSCYYDGPELGPCLVSSWVVFDTKDGPRGACCDHVVHVCRSAMGGPAGMRVHRVVQGDMPVMAVPAHRWAEYLLARDAMQAES